MKPEQTADDPSGQISSNFFIAGDTSSDSYELTGIPVQVHIRSTPAGRRYDLIEPLLNQYEQELYASLKTSLKIHLKDRNMYRQYQQNYDEHVQTLISTIAPDLSLSSIAVLKYYLTRDTKGFGPFEPYLRDPYLIRITLPGYGLAVLVEHQKFGTMLTNFIPDQSEFHRIVKKAENRSGIKISSESLPVSLPLKEGIIQISTSPTGDNGPYFLEYQRPRHTPEYATVQKKTDRKIVAVSRYLDGKAIGKLLSDGKGRYWFSAELPSRHGSVKRLNHVQWIRLFIADPLILAITCPGPDSSVRVLHIKSNRPVLTNIKPTAEDLDSLSAFFIRSAGKPGLKTPGLQRLRFKGGTHVTITRGTVHLPMTIEIHKSQASDTLAAPEPAHGGQAKDVSFGDEKADEILAKVFDLDAQESSSSQREEEESSGGSDGKKGPRTWRDKFGRSLRWRLSDAGFRRKKERPDPNAEAPLPETPQVKSVLAVQVPEGLVAEEAYWLVAPHAYAVVLKDPAGDRMYRVIEPELTPRERIILEETHETLRDVLIYDKPVNKGDLFLDFDEAAKVIKTYDPKISDDRLSVLYYFLKRNLNGYGKIDPLMYDEMLEDISCNGHHLPVYVHHRFYASMPTSVIFDQEELNRFVLKLSQKADKQVSLTSPLLDAALPNGSRAQITYSDVVSTKGSSFTIRKFRSDPMTPITLLSFGTYDPELLAFLWLALENRKSLIVVGGTASGKTSAMNALSFFIPHNSKIVSLEDTRELQIPHQNWLPVQTRESVALHERGNIDLFDLLKASLRQRPEYIIVGEVRGSEAQTLFQAMNSGHTTLSTLHAGTIEEAMNRLTNAPINVPPAMFGALDLMVIQTFHYRGGRMIRRCDAVHEIVLKEGDKLGWNTLFEYNPGSDGFDRKYNKSKTLENIRYMHNWTEPELQYHLRIRKDFLTRIKNQHKSDPVHLMQLITRLRKMA